MIHPNLAGMCGEIICLAWSRAKAALQVSVLNSTISVIQGHSRSTLKIWSIFCHSRFQINSYVGMILTSKHCVENLAWLVMPRRHIVAFRRFDQLVGDTQLSDGTHELVLENCLNNII